MEAAYALWSDMHLSFSSPATPLSHLTVGQKEFLRLHDVTLNSKPCTLCRKTLVVLASSKLYSLGTKLLPISSNELKVFKVRYAAVLTSYQHLRMRLGLKSMPLHDDYATWHCMQSIHIYLYHAVIFYWNITLKIHPYDNWPILPVEYWNRSDVRSSLQ